MFSAAVVGECSEKGRFFVLLANYGAPHEGVESAAAVAARAPNGTRLSAALRLFAGAKYTTFACRMVLAFHPSLADASGSCFKRSATSLNSAFSTSRAKKSKSRLPRANQLFMCVLVPWME